MRSVCAVLCGAMLMLQVMRNTAQTAGDSANEDCGQLESCRRCIDGDPALNLTRCVWRSCDSGDNENNTGCVSDSTEDSPNCTLFDEIGMCSAPESSDTDGEATPGPAPEFSQATFDLSSFIGGIILVLVLQAGVFFAMRFLKTKDSTYETIDQPAQ